MQHAAAWLRVGNIHASCALDFAVDKARRFWFFVVRLPFHSFQEDEIFPIGLAIMDVGKAIQSLSHKYTPLGEKQQLMDGASVTTDSSEAEEAPRRIHGPSSSWRRPFTIHLFIFCVQLLLWWGFTMILWRSSRDQLCTAHTSRYWSE